MGALSRRGSQRNCSGGADAAYPQKDEKTPEPLLYAGIEFWIDMCSIGGRL